MSKKITWALIAYICFVFIQSLFFKFAGDQQTVIIFNTIGEWMKSISLPNGLADNFAKHGGSIVGIAELIACALLIIPATRLFGALLALGVISGAIFFHLFTPLGVNRVIDEAGNTDGGVLFFMAVGVWVASALIIFLRKR